MKIGGHIGGERRTLECLCDARLRREVKHPPSCEQAFRLVEKIAAEEPMTLERSASRTTGVEAGRQAMRPEHASMAAQWAFPFMHAFHAAQDFKAVSEPADRLKACNLSEKGHPASFASWRCTDDTLPWKLPAREDIVRCSSR
jgi:hypothetical protein